MFKNYKRLYEEQKSEIERFENMFKHMGRFLHESAVIFHNIGNSIETLRGEEWKSERSSKKVEDIDDNFRLLKKIFRFMSRRMSEKDGSAKRNIDFKELILSVSAYLKLRYRSRNMIVLDDNLERVLVYCDDIEIESLIILIIETCVIEFDHQFLEKREVLIQSNQVDDSIELILLITMFNEIISKSALSEIREAATRIIEHSHNGKFKLVVDSNFIKFIVILPLNSKSI